VKLRRLSERDFLRLDKPEIVPFSYLQTIINELASMHPVRALVCKVLLSPLWFTFSYSLPLIRVKEVDARIRKLRNNSWKNKLCIRSQVPFVFDSLARVIVLDEQRVDKRGHNYKVLRNELNKSLNRGYKTEIFQGQVAMKILDDFSSSRGRRNWRNETRLDLAVGDIRLAVCAGFNSSGEIISVGAMWVSQSYAYLFFYDSVEKLQIRWLLIESLIEFAYGVGVILFHTDNLMDTSTGSYVFQNSLGYTTARLSFRRNLNNLHNYEIKNTKNGSKYRF